MENPKVKQVLFVSCHKGTMVQAELHFIRSRLQGGKLNKAQKGELRFPLPVGYVFDEANRIVKDPDEQVCSAIELVFTAFLELGSAYAVVHRFARENLLFPKRSYGGVWAGKLQYEQVDPNHRLVASTLEQRWNDALIELEDVQNQIVELQQKENVISSQQREDVLKLAQDLPRLWKSHTTSTKDKKRILQLLIQDITVEKPKRGGAILHLRWQGGQCEDLPVELPRPAAERWRHSDVLVQRVRELAENYSDEEIAAHFNAEGLKSNKGNAFTRSSISWIRHKHAIPPVDKKRPEEQTVKDVSRQFRVNPGVVYYWIANKIITARRLNHGSPYWITIDPQKKRELETWVRESNRIQPR